MPDRPSSDVAFTDAVKAVQTRRRSRGLCAKVEACGGFRTSVTPELAAFLAGVDTAYLGRRTRSGSPMRSTEAAPVASSACWTGRRSALPIMPATGSM